MRKIFQVFLTLLTFVRFANAQTNIIAGTVKDDQGSPLRYIFVHDTQSKRATFTDSLGDFSIQVEPKSRLELQSPGHTDTILNIIPGSNKLEITLKAAKGNTTRVYAGLKLVTTTVRTTTEGDLGTVSSGGTISGMKHQKEGVRGRRYLFDEFLPGYVISSDDQLVYNPSYHFNYDKIGGALLLTEDNNTVTQVSTERIKSFSIFGDGDRLYTFEMVPALNKSHYVQVLSSGPKYTIYKLVLTHLVKSDYTNAGITSHGSDYDEFVDDETYAVLDAKTNRILPLSPKKKSIKADFIKEADKVNKYLSDNSGDINDAYLRKLGDYMNQ